MQEEIRQDTAGRKGSQGRSCAQKPIDAATLLRRQARQLEEERSCLDELRAELRER